jgi:hypothetical protein
VKEAPDYADLAVKAEKAVAHVKDPELRRIAYQKILEDLLSNPSKKPGSATSTKPAPAKGGGGATPKASGPQAYVEELVAEGFFDKQKTITQVRAELENRGHHIPTTSLSGPMQKLCQRRVLRRQKASGSDEKKQTFAYSNW